MKTFSFTTKGKIKKYLENKEKSQYNQLDRILEMYLNGQLKKLLSKYSKVGIYPSIGKNCKSIQLNYNYNNIYVIIDFFEDKYDEAVYPSGITANELEHLAAKHDYQDNFDLAKCIEEIDNKVKTHPKLKNSSFVEKRKKTYSILKWICLCLPLVVIGSLAIIGFITGTTIQGNMWWGIGILVFLILAFVFDLLST